MYLSSSVEEGGNAMEIKERIRFFSTAWLIVAILVFISWPMSHWLYYGLYAKFLGVPQGAYQDSLIKMIGSCGVLLSLCLLVVSKEPTTSYLLVKMISVFMILLSVTFMYLVFFSDFSRVELLNAGFFIIIAVMLPVSHRWANQPETKNGK
jgi:hypothetical protein